MNQREAIQMTDIASLLGAEAESLLSHTCATITKEQLHLPGSDFVDRIFIDSDRPIPVLKNLQALYGAGRLGGTGYLSILPVDQAIEHTAGASFAPNPLYFDPENIVKLAVESGCSGVASTLGVLGICARKWAHRIPFILKFNHNELMTYPNKHDQILFASIKQAFEMGCTAVGATIYFGHETSNRQIQEVSRAFEAAHAYGLGTILWAYTRNDAFKTAEKDYHVAADLTGQANHLAATLKADIVKQKMAENNGGFTAIKFAKSHPAMYDKLCTDHPIDLCRYQVANTYMGRIGLINSGGGAGSNDLVDAVRTAVINKRAGGQGLIMGRKAFTKSFADGVALTQAVQDVYLDEKVTIA